MSPIKTTKGGDFCFRIPPKEDPSSESVIVSRPLTERRVRFESSYRIYPSPPGSYQRNGNSIRLRRVDYKESISDSSELSPAAAKAFSEFEKNKYLSKIFLLQSEIEELKILLGKAKSRNAFLEKRVEALTDIIKSS